MQDMIRLIEPLIPKLRRYARSLLNDRAAADDLVQDCLERVITRWHQRRRDGDARAWVFTILHNLAINRLRQSARRGPHQPLDAVGEDVLSQSAAQEHGLRHQDLMGALDELPHEQRSVLLLVAVEDMTYAEVATVLDVPIGTVMSRLSRARDKLLRLLEPDAVSTMRTVPLRRVK